MTDLLLVEKVAEAIALARFCRQHPYIPVDKITGIIPDALDAEDAQAAIAAMPGYEAGLVEGARAQWHPIETAPKDGTRILLGRFTGDPKADREGLQDVDWYRTIAAKRGYVGFGHFNKQFWPATHWMPLPSPPSIADDGKEGAG